MMEEWLSNIRKTYGFKNANLKLAKLMHFYYESDVSFWHLQIKKIIV
jgi:hypothetical protein